MPFYGTLALIYITVGALFGLLCVLHRKELIQVQVRGNLCLATFLTNF
jgi:hypothetical protein